MNVTVFGVGLCQLLVGLSRLGFVFCVDTQLQELVQEINGFLEVTKLLVDVSDLLVALSLLILVFRPLGSVQALLEVTQGLVVVQVVLELGGDDLIDSD